MAQTLPSLGLLDGASQSPTPLQWSSGTQPAPAKSPSAIQSDPQMYHKQPFIIALPPKEKKEKIHPILQEVWFSCKPFLVVQLGLSTERKG